MADESERETLLGFMKTLDENVKSLKEDNKRSEAEFKDIRKRLEAIEAPPPHRRE